ncbi:zinc finger domain-containing protein [Streptomyces subrutilus]|uniref:zinc finger domain-containing protein n=1 Tax=Streptomyces subrutilus TaxID=36818 RepID=UPI003F53E9B1
MTTIPPLAILRRKGGAGSRISAVLPHSALDAMLDAAYETNRRFRHGAFAEPCPTCHVSPGELCLARRSVHAARRLAHRARVAQTSVTPLTEAVPR